jgi:hypothetical protein
MRLPLLLVHISVTAFSVVSFLCPPTLGFPVLIFPVSPLLLPLLLLLSILTGMGATTAAIGSI